MPRGHEVDLVAMHKDLWERADRLGRLKIMQKEYAVEQGVTYFTICRVFKKLEEDGRMKKLVSHKGNTWTYMIRDPENF